VAEYQRDRAKCKDGEGVTSMPPRTVAAYMSDSPWRAILRLPRVAETPGIEPAVAVHGKGCRLRGAVYTETPPSMDISAPVT